MLNNVKFNIVKQILPVTITAYCKQKNESLTWNTFTTNDSYQYISMHWVRLNQYTYIEQRSIVLIWLNMFDIVNSWALIQKKEAWIELVLTVIAHSKKMLMIHSLPFFCDPPPFFRRRSCFSPWLRLRCHSWSWRNLTTCTCDVWPKSMITFMIILWSYRHCIFHHLRHRNIISKLS